MLAYIVRLLHYNFVWFSLPVGFFFSLVGRNHSSAGNFPFPAPWIRPLCNSNAAVWLLAETRPEDKTRRERTRASKGEGISSIAGTLDCKRIEECQKNSVSTLCLIHLNLAHLYIKQPCARSQPENETNLYHIINNKDYFLVDVVVASQCRAVARLLNSLLIFICFCRLPSRSGSAHFPTRVDSLCAYLSTIWTQKAMKASATTTTDHIISLTHIYLLLNHKTKHTHSRTNCVFFASSSSSSLVSFRFAFFSSRVPCIFTLTIIIHIYAFYIDADWL